MQTASKCWPATGTYEGESTTRDRCVIPYDWVPRVLQICLALYHEFNGLPTLDNMPAAVAILAIRCEINDVMGFGHVAVSPADCIQDCRLDNPCKRVYDVAYHIGCDVSFSVEVDEPVARYPLNLPQQLKKDAEEWAARQGVSLNQFILWAIAEKVGSLGQDLDDPDFPRINYRRGSSGQPVPVLRGTGIRVQTIVVESQQWGLSPAEIAEEYGVTQAQVEEALSFFQTHRREIEISLAVEKDLEEARA